MPTAVVTEGRRAGAVDAVERKFEAAFEQVYPAGHYEEVLTVTSDQARLERTPVHDFMAMLSMPGGAQDGATVPARATKAGAAGQ